MKSDELLQIVESVRNERMQYKREESIVTLANHAAAMVGLVRACEEIGTRASGLDASPDAIARIRAALRAVHAIEGDRG